MNENYNVSKTVSIDLCMGCGTCAGICPNNAISMKIENKRGIYLPIIESDLCNYCAKCLKVCPDLNIVSENRTSNIKDGCKYNSLIGNYKECYVGHSFDQSIRFQASSGGLISSLLIYALESNIIDGALVTRMSDNDPLIAEPFIARSKKEILSSASSKYCPIPLNIIIKKILDLDYNEKIAVVGLPCHIQGIRNAEALNTELKRKVIFHFGIMCARNDNFQFINYLLYKYSIKREDVKSLSFRGNGWPGFLSIKHQSGKITNIPYEDYIPVHLFEIFPIKRCGMCLDPTNMKSDFSFCDAWGIMKNDKLGSSLVISRNELGDNLIRAAIKNDAITLETIPVNIIENSQGLFTKNFILRKLSNIKIQQICHKKDNNSKIKTQLYQELKPLLIHFTINFIISIQRYILARKFFWRFIDVFTKIEYKYIR